jgi:hypothetical protein
MRTRHIRALASGVFLCALVAQATTEQASFTPSSTAADGRVRSELSLLAHTATLRFAPNLRADDPAHRGVVSARASGDPAVRVAQLETNGSLRLGTIALGKDNPAGIRYDLWLESAGDAWRLRVTEAQRDDAGQPAALIGQLTLARSSGVTSSPTFMAALVPNVKDAGRLLVRWGEYEAATEVQFTDPPRRRQTERTPANVTTNRAHDEDTSALSRARLLAQRNETVLGSPDGRRLSVSYARQGLEVEGRDFRDLASAPDGRVIQLTESAVPRLRIEAPLRFGNATIRIGNQGAGFPGSYGLWLKRVGSGWRLVLNHEADAWGSQHDPKFDAAEIPLIHTDGHPASRPFAVALLPIAADRGRLLILWGPHEWSAEFAIG